MARCNNVSADIMPSIMLTNANRILNKLNELSILCHSYKPAIIAICETWLSSEISDNHVLLYNYRIFRRDRTERIGGGVMFYIRNDIRSWRLDNLDTDRHEVLWVALRPKILPRPFSLLILCIVYCPPWYNVDLKMNLTSYLTTTIDNIYRKYPNAAFIVCGDFNSYNTDFIVQRFHFTQISSSSTRGDNVLDKLFLNCCKYYLPVAEILPPLGKSDHNCVYLGTLTRNDMVSVGWRSVFSRRVNDSSIDAFGVQLAAVDWRPLYFSNDTVSVRLLLYNHHHFYL